MEKYTYVNCLFAKLSFHLLTTKQTILKSHLPEKHVCGTIFLADYGNNCVG